MSVDGHIVQPDLGLVEVAVAVAPPLAGRAARAPIIARIWPSGDAAEKNSLAYRSALTGIGVPPSGDTR